MMNRRRNLSLILLPLALLFSALGCGPVATETPLPNEAIVALTVQAVLDAGGTPLPPTEIAPTEVPPTVEISVTPTLTPTSTSTPTQTPVPTPCDAAQFVTDVTIADDSSVTVNAGFTKTWRLSNVGTCTWTSGYQLVFDHGDRMSAPDAVMLTSGTVPPGSTVDVSVTLKAPAAAGTYQGFFKLRNPSGVLFGVGADANTAFWVKIKAETFLLIQPIPVFPLLPLVQSFGTGATIGHDQCFNLDDGTGEGCGSGDADFVYVVVLFEGKIDPKDSVKFSSKFNAEPSYSECSGASLSAATFAPTENRSYCYKTSDDNFGWIKVTNADMTTLQFDWTTW
jgi:hypothetical protein